MTPQVNSTFLEARIRSVVVSRIGVPDAVRCNEGGGKPDLQAKACPFSTMTFRESGNAVAVPWRPFYRADRACRDPAFGRFGAFPLIIEDQLVNGRVSQFFKFGPYECPGISLPWVGGLLFFLGHEDRLGMGMNQRHWLGCEGVVEDAEHFDFGRAEFIDGINQSQARMQSSEGGQNLLGFRRSATQVALIDGEDFADGHLVVERAVPLQKFVARVGQEGRFAGAIAFADRYSRDREVGGKEPGGWCRIGNLKVVSNSGRSRRGELLPIDHGTRGPDRLGCFLFL